MTRSSLLQPHGSRPVGLALVVLLHVLMLGLFMSARLKPSTPPLAPSLVQLRLLASPTDRAAAQPARAKPDTAASRTAALRPPLANPSAHLATRLSTPQPDAELASPKPPTTERISSTQVAPEAAPLAASSPLNLALPASSLERAPAIAALRDPRSNTQRPDFGERMAAALGSDPSRREEIIGPGHRRIRKGSSCYDVHDARDAQINPFDERTRGNKLISPCKP